ncbi:alpha/beta hydrolase [Sandaracinus amylolyticus]|uniref:alpha/beta hydrolase n=1 Tax=Sandaracinus amylolyticus TaxID=927083 RepID=UPI001F2FAA34|nr:alpha/beta hydrolase [Sandaracinus amylolyticus]UJR80333.1 AB hydrolase-1 domain-containing protein [Sandaracinus amylolyticus]
MRRRTCWLAPFLATSIVALACTRAEPSGTTSEAPRPEAPAPPTPREPEPEAPSPEPREVRFTTSDGVTITGTLRAAAAPDAPLVILVHQLGSDRSEWAPLIERLERTPRVATLAIDLRGHGASTEREGGAALSWRDFDNDAWAHTADDVVAAIEFVRSDASGVRPSRIGLVGSSIGSTAVIAANARSEGIGPVIAISPGRAYRGFDAITPGLELSGHDFLAVVAREEPDSVETASAMGRITSTEPVIVEGSAHGVALLRDHADVLDRVEAVLRRALGAERAG